MWSYICKPGAPQCTQTSTSLCKQTLTLCPCRFRMLADHFLAMYPNLNVNVDSELEQLKVRRGHQLHSHGWQNHGSQYCSGIVWLAWPVSHKTFCQVTAGKACCTCSVASIDIFISTCIAPAITSQYGCCGGEKCGSSLKILCHCHFPSSQDCPCVFSGLCWEAASSGDWWGVLHAQISHWAQ